MDFELIDIENKPGFYRDLYGEWVVDRRKIPDRREIAKVTDEVRAMPSKDLRRESDRALRDYLQATN
jgi:hypothetical protein